MKSNSIEKCMCVLPDIPMKSMGKTHVDLTGKPYKHFLYFFFPIFFSSIIYLNPLCCHSVSKRLVVEVQAWAVDELSQIDDCLSLVVPVVASCNLEKSISLLQMQQVFLIGGTVTIIEGDLLKKGLLSHFLYYND